LKKIKLKEETTLLGNICRHSSLKSDDDVISLITKDDHELAKVLLSIYKENKEDYLKIT
jgi:hypothetical protein